ncbi:MAG: hypothetical protein AB1305_02990 [Candidatus Hadarchaeota archaeon]
MSGDEFAVLILLVFVNIALLSWRRLLKKHNQVLLGDYADCLRTHKASEPLKKVEPDVSVLVDLVDEDTAKSLMSAAQLKYEASFNIRDLEKRELAQALDEAEIKLGLSQNIRTTGRYFGGDLGNEVIFVRTDANPKKKFPDAVFSLAPLLPLVPYLVWILNIALFALLLCQLAESRSLSLALYPHEEAPRRQWAAGAVDAAGEACRAGKACPPPPAQAQPSHPLGERADRAAA